MESDCAAPDDDRLSDADIRDRLAALSLRSLDAGGAWVRRTESARLAWLTAQAMLPDSPTLYVSQVSMALQLRVQWIVWCEAEEGGDTGDLAPHWQFLRTGRALNA